MRLTKNQQHEIDCLKENGPVIVNSIVSPVVFKTYKSLVNKGLVIESKLSFNGDPLKHPTINSKFSLKP
jgi:hypothetical protein